MLKLRLLAVATLFAANTASAQVLLNDTFNGLNGGNSQLNYTTLPNFTVLNGTVDLIKSGDFGISCVGGSGSCIDLDGSRSASGTIGTQTFFFGAGDSFALNFDVSGNQRGGASDFFTVFLRFGVNTAYTGGTSSGALAGGVSSSGTFAPSYFIQTSLTPNAPWTASGVGFTFVNAGQVSVEFATQGNDNVGPVLDNVVITRTSPTSVVPEPSTYALMAAGLGALALVARRRRA
jgi:hypothetical protein